MPDKKRVLWIEDSARFELAGVLGPVFASHRYDLTLAENATTAAEYLRRRQFDAIIVDIRLPPGPNGYWRSIYRNAGSDRTNAKLGLALLAWLLAGTASSDAASTTDRRTGSGRRRNGATMPRRPEWGVPPESIGVFSAERRGEIGGDLISLGVLVQREKQPGLPDTVLLDILDELLPESPGQPGGPTHARPDDHTNG